VLKSAVGHSFNSVRILSPISDESVNGWPQLHCLDASGQVVARCSQFEFQSGRSVWMYGEESCCSKSSDLSYIEDGNETVLVSVGVFEAPYMRRGQLQLKKIEAAAKRARYAWLDSCGWTSNLTTLFEHTRVPTSTKGKLQPLQAGSTLNGLIQHISGLCSVDCEHLLGHIQSHHVVLPYIKLLEHAVIGYSHICSVEGGVHSS
jgi:hypothetical protein